MLKNGIKVLTATISILSLFALTGCGGNTPTATSAVQATKDAKVVVVSWGGAYQDAQRKAMFEPFMKDTGVKLTEDSPTDLGKLKSMVANKDVQWDVVDTLGSDIPKLASAGLLEPIDYSLVDKSNLLDSSAQKYSVGIDYYSTVLAYNTGNLPSGQVPQNWADFFDLKKFPGKRSLYKNPISTIEIALLADGVDPKKLYPLDVDRAFKKLDTIKSQIVWWEQGAQPAQLLADKEVIMADAWNARISDAAKKGQPLAYTYEGAVLDEEGWVIPKGAKNQSAAMKFVNYASQAKQQADLLNAMPYGPTNKKAFDFMDANYAKTLPTYPDNLKKQVYLDPTWWSENGNFDKINDRFQAWLLK